MQYQCLRWFCRAAQGSGLEQNKTKQVLSPSWEAERAGAVAFASASHRGICSENTPPEPALGVAYGEVNVPTNGHTVCEAT